MFRIAGLAVIAILTAVSSTAADSAAPMDKLAPLEGEFVLEGTRFTPDGPVANREIPTTGRFLLNGRMLEEHRFVDFGQPDLTEMLTQITYDQYRNVYRAAVIDDTWGIMDVYEGVFDEAGNLVMTNLRSDTFFPLPDGKKMHFRLSWGLADQPKTFRVDSSVDGGSSWQPMVEDVFVPVHPMLAVE